MIVLDVDIAGGWNDDRAFLICGCKTGIYYTSQCGGLSCDHPEYEGFLITIYDVSKKIDDCEYGCSRIGKDNTKLKKLADKIDEILKETYSGIVSLTFDYDRILETKEGWWPVNVVLSDKMTGLYFSGHGIVCGWNCD